MRASRYSGNTLGAESGMPRIGFWSSVVSVVKDKSETSDVVRSEAGDVIGCEGNGVIEAPHP